MRYPLFIFLSAVACTPCLAQTPDSLFDASRARIAGADLAGLLGPKSVGNRYDRRMIEAAQRAHERTQQQRLALASLSITK